MNLNKIYESQKENIEKRLYEFRRLWNYGGDDELFMNMVFCMCTPQTKAHAGWDAANELKKTGALVNGSQSEIEGILKKSGVRFHKNKTKYIIENRQTFYPKTKSILEPYLDKNDVVAARNSLKNRVKGWGYKEASHFLRNIGFGQNIAILDRHIMRTLKSNNMINEEVDLNKEYMSVEEKMRLFSMKLGIPLDALDLVIWYDVNGEIFR